MGLSDQTDRLPVSSPVHDPHFLGVVVTNHHLVKEDVLNHAVTPCWREATAEPFHRDTIPPLYRRLAQFHRSPGNGCVMKCSIAFSLASAKASTRLNWCTGVTRL